MYTYMYVHAHTNMDRCRHGDKHRHSDMEIDAYIICIYVLSSKSIRVIAI